jgi:5'(3')-deoxyribonucleotidase
VNERRNHGKRIVYLDMDNTLVDFPSGLRQVDEDTLAAYSGREDEIPGIFALMDPLPGAVEAFHTLSVHFDVYILSTAPWENASAWSDKNLWVKRFLGGDPDSPAYKRLILSHHKNLNLGDFLVDDRPHKNGADRFIGEVIHFGSGEFPDWPSVVNYLVAAA